MGIQKITFKITPESKDLLSRLIVDEFKSLKGAWHHPDKKLLMDAAEELELHEELKKYMNT